MQEGHKPMTAPAGAAPSAAVVQPASTTGTQGGNDTASPPASSAAPRAEAEQAPRKTLKERAKELFGMKADQPTAEKKPAGDAEVQAEKKDSPEANDTIPLAAFKERLHRESEKTKAARSELHAAQLETKRQSAALEIAMAEIQRLSQAVQSGAKLDPRDEKIRAMELANQARAKAEEIQGAHAGDIDKAAEADAVAEVRQQVSQELDGAIASHPLLHRAELIAACKRKDNLGRSISEVAAELDASKFDLVRKRIAAEKPASPSTVMPSGGGQGGHQFPNNARGMAARLAVLRQTGH